MIVLIFFTNMTIIAVPLVITTDQRESPGEAITTPGTTCWREAPTPGPACVGFQNMRSPRARVWNEGGLPPRDGGGWVLPGERLIKRASFYAPTPALSAGPAWLGGCRTSAFCQVSREGGGHLLLQAQFAQGIKTHTSPHRPPSREERVCAGGCAVLGRRKRAR